MGRQQGKRQEDTGKRKNAQRKSGFAFAGERDVADLAPGRELGREHRQVLPGAVPDVRVRVPSIGEGSQGQRHRRRVYAVAVHGAPGQSRANCGRSGRRRRAGTFRQRREPPPRVEHPDRVDNKALRADSLVYQSARIREGPAGSSCPAGTSPSSVRRTTPRSASTSWCASNKRGMVYAMRRTRDGRSVYMHRQIMKAAEGHVRGPQELPDLGQPALQLADCVPRGRIR